MSQINAPWSNEAIVHGIGVEGRRMAQEQGRSPIHEAVGVFKDADKLQAAIDELLSSGFDRAELSLLASEHTVEKHLGHRYRKVAELEDDACAPRVCYVSPESVGDAEGILVGALFYVGAVAATGAVVASGGTIAAALAASVLAGGAGGLVGAALAKLVGDAYARRMQEQLDHGGLLLWVRTWNDDDENKAVKILSSHSAFDVHVHALPAPN